MYKCLIKGFLTSTNHLVNLIIKLHNLLVMIYICLIIDRNLYLTQNIKNNFLFTMLAWNNNDYKHITNAC